MVVTRTLFGADAEVLRNPNYRLLLLANIMGPLGPALVSPLLESLTGPFDVSTATVGLMISAFIAPGILIIPLAGVLSDRYGRRIVLVVGLVLFGIGGSAIAFTTDFRVVLALRLLQGTGAAGMVPVIIASIGDLYEGTIEATAQGLRFTTSGLAQAVFPAIAGVLVGVAWQYPFLIYGLALPIAVLVALRFQEPTSGTNADGQPSSRDLLRFLLQPHVLVMVFAFATTMLHFIGYLTYISALLALGGGTASQAGLLVALMNVALAIGASQAGRITATFDSRLLPLLATNVTMAVGLGTVALTSNIAVSAVGGAVLGGSIGIALSLYRSVATGLPPAGLRGAFVSLVESALRAGATIAPLVMGAAIVLAEPSLGSAAALRWTVLVGSVAASATTVTSLLVAALLSPDR